MPADDIDHALSARLPADRRKPVAGPTRCPSVDLQKDAVGWPLGRKRGVPLLRAHRWSHSDVAAAALFCVLLAPVAARAAQGVGGPIDLLTVLLALPLGALAADLTSGLVHWACDSFFTERTPVIGRALIEPFREHHRDPLAMTRKGFLRVSRANLFIMSFGLAVTWWREDGWTADCHSSLAHAWWFWYACAVGMTNQLHMWAHAERVPRPVRRLHALRLIVSPSHHRRHHRPPYRRGYCVTTGWINPVLDHVGFFAGLERAVRALQAQRLADPHGRPREGGRPHR